MPWHLPERRRPTVKDKVAVVRAQPRCLADGMISPDQPIGFPLPDWTARPRPPRAAMQGRLARVEPLDPERHADNLFGANSADDGRMWTYMGYGPFASLADFVGASRQALAGQGLWMAMKGKRPQAEIDALPAGVDVFHVEQLAVPGLDAERCIVWMRPVGTGG